MKTTLALALAGFLSLTAISAQAAQSLIDAAQAKPAPSWTVTDLEGKTLKSADLKGKVVVVDFWATWCPPCVAEVPGYVQLQKKYGDKLVILGFSLDQQGPSVVKSFAKKHNVNYPLALPDEKVTSSFGDIRSIPTTFIIDQEGRIRYKKVGGMETAEFESLLKPLLK